MRKAEGVACEKCVDVEREDLTITGHEAWIIGAGSFLALLWCVGVLTQWHRVDGVGGPVLLSSMLCIAITWIALDLRKLWLRNWTRRTISYVFFSGGELHQHAKPPMIGDVQGLGIVIENQGSACRVLETAWSKTDPRWMVVDFDLSSPWKLCGMNTGPDVTLQETYARITLPLVEALQLLRTDLNMMGLLDRCFNAPVDIAALQEQRNGLIGGYVKLFLWADRLHAHGRRSPHVAALMRGMRAILERRGVGEDQFRLDSKSEIRDTARHMKMYPTAIFTCDCKGAPPVPLLRVHTTVYTCLYCNREKNLVDLPLAPDLS